MRRNQGGGGGGGGMGKKAALPKGCMAIRVGRKEEKMQRFIVPVEYVNHPLFAGLLKEAEEEYGFKQTGSIRIPCHVEIFRQVQGVIDSEHSGQGHSHHLHFANCFKV